MAQLPSYGGDEYYKPFWAWNRLEGRPRKKDYERVLKAEIHDALWMLGRQWQMGEFKGNDTGSGILARLQMNYTSVNAFSSYGSNTPVPYDSSLMPLEPLVEPVIYDWSIKERVMMGKKWMRMLKAQFPSTFTAYETSFTDPVNELVIDTTEPDNNLPEGTIFSKSEIFSQKPLYNFQVGIAVVNNVIDGGKLFTILDGQSPTAALATLQGSPYNITVPAPEEPGMQLCIQDYCNWVRKMYSLPVAGAGEHWNKEKMEYEFKFYAPKDNTTAYPLIIRDYHSGHLDWYSFLQGDEIQENGPAPDVKELQIIMAEAGFPGMPSSRWWEFEDGAVNFCQLDANTTDIAKIITTQFALVYQDDWFLVPVKVPVGSYSDIKGIVVTDVFGVRTFVANHNVNSYNAASGFSTDNNWKHWRWLDICMDTAAINLYQPAGKLMLPPVTGQVMEGKPIESVLFIRDEMSNMVWGIEKVVPDNMGRGTDGDNRARSFVDYIRVVNPASEQSAAPPNDAKIKYELNATIVPENWIPFMPVHTALSNRDIQLQRASMPRIMQPYEISLIRPRTSILRYDIGSDNIPTAPYLLNEEEVPRAGAIVQTSFQRCRWYNGSTFSWVGRKKITGRGEGSSGLEFDKIKDVS